jgi:hypothetical protein
MPELTVTLSDSASADVTDSLRQLATARRVPIFPSGFTTGTRNNSHGEVLRRFVLAHPERTHDLFLDADVCFVGRDTIPSMVGELEADARAFGIGARQSWDGLVEKPEAVRRENPDICDARLHPSSALERNTPLFGAVVEEIGLG